MDYTPPDQPTADEHPSAPAPPAGPPTPVAGQSPAQMPYQPSGQYLPPAPPPPPPPRKGFNWLACCGITCAVLLIVGGLVAYCGYRFFQPFMGMAMELPQLQTEVQQTDIQTIKSAAMSVDAATLVSNPATYEGQWLELTAKIDNTNQLGGAPFPGNNAGGVQSTNYALEENILLMDITQSPLVGNPGDEIIAYGKIYSWNIKELEKMPIVGKSIGEEMQKDPTMQGNMQLVFFIAKEVTLAPVTGGSSAASGNAAGDSADDDNAASDTGWE
jgi:hypothetical protein